MEINGIAQKITRIALFNLPGTFIFLPIFPIEIFSIRLNHSVERISVRMSKKITYITNL